MDKTFIPKTKKKRTILVASALALTSAGAFVAYAQTTGVFGTPPRLIPYVGHLDFNGVAKNGKVDMTFFLVEDAGHTFANKIWFEDHTGSRAVDVVAGRFSAALGRYTTIPDSTLLKQQLYIGVKVGDVSTTTVELTGKQRLMSAPHAITTAQASELYVRSGSRTSVSDIGGLTVDDAVNGISMGYDTAKNEGWIYSRSVGCCGRPLNLNNGIVTSASSTTSLGNHTVSGTLDTGFQWSTANATVVNCPVGKKVISWGANCANYIARSYPVNAYGGWHVDCDGTFSAPTPLYVLCARVTSTGP